MKERQISEADALVLCKRAEGHFFDRKAAAISGQKLQKIVVALANADGGEVVVGIADDKDEPDPTKRWGGFQTVEDFNGFLQAIHTLNPSVDARYEFLKHDTKGTVALHIFVERSADVNKTSDGKVYQRSGAQSLPLSADQITELGFAKGARSYENMKLPDLTPEQIADAHELASFLADYSPSTDPLDYAVNQHLVDSKEWTPLVAGILLFGDNPSAMLPRKCGVRISRYETREDDPERAHLKESYYIEGPAYQLIHAAVNKITSILSNISMWGSQGSEQKGYPPEAIWEVFVNAIIHRDYSISDDVHVTIFNDRIEISSPGKLPGYVRVDNILDARFSRNSKMVRCLNRYSDAPNKDMGEGLNTAFQKMKEWKLKPPIIEEDGNYIKVTIRHAPLALPTEAIMTFLEDHAEITNAQARQLTGIKSENAVKKEFYKLRDQGIIERVPNRGGGHAAWRKVGAA
ncbi:putative DNA binding domain-containing protein [Methylobacterium sp. E-025]|uniref:ATP-binding protein n=1 Tax=Methylobacterium sp. E-025 TaxID=2836561 RepID=UPI001FBA5186|nr:ATP-binding protein [Methylobacterium sp. E-025]MCJ2110497.1 putative DNA binding domain-containing protein [Methylobacterium sp. E-025]